MTLTRKQLDRLAPALRGGMRISSTAPAGVDARQGDLVMVSQGQYMSLYVVIDRAGQVRQRKAIFKT